MQLDAAPPDADMRHPLASIPDGRGLVLHAAIKGPPCSVIVLRSGDHCVAYLNRCPHFGVELATVDAPLYVEAGEWLKCNVHYAKFRWHDGVCFSGDCAGESLVAIPCSVRDGVVHVRAADIAAARAAAPY